MIFISVLMPEFGYSYLVFIEPDCNFFIYLVADGLSSPVFAKTRELNLAFSTSVSLSSFINILNSENSCKLLLNISSSIAIQFFYSKKGARESRLPESVRSDTQPCFIFITFCFSQKVSTWLVEGLLFWYQQQNKLRLAGHKKFRGLITPNVDEFIFCAKLECDTLKFSQQALLEAYDWLPGVSQRNRFSEFKLCKIHIVFRQRKCLQKKRLFLRSPK